MAKIGICCDYATCFTNLTHFPKQDAQVVFIYLVTTVITLYNCALLWVSQHNHRDGRKEPLNDCLSVCVQKVGALGLQPNESGSSALCGLRGDIPVPWHHTLLSTLYSQPPPQIANSSHTGHVFSWILLPCLERSAMLGGVRGPSKVHESSPYCLTHLMFFGDCLFNCFAKEMSASRGKPGMPAGQECMVFAFQHQQGAWKGESAQ